MSCLLFFDDSMLISYDNLQRLQGRPLWQPQATLEDALTEGTCNFPCVWHDKQAGLYRAVYGAPLALSKDKDAGQTKPRPTVPPLYAQSPDGITWTIPDLREELNLPGESLAINQVFPSTPRISCGPAYYDPYDPDPDRRLKAFVEIDPYSGLITSPIDGKHWKIAEEYRNLTNTDFPISMFYHRHRQNYVVSGRQMIGQHSIDRRTVTLMETGDWRTFSSPQTVAHVTPNDPPLCEFYGMPIFEYEEVYIGLLWRIFGNSVNHKRPIIGGMIDNVMTYSYDGRLFNRGLNQPFIEPTELGQHGCGCVYTSSMLIDDQNVIRFYSGGSKSEHYLDTNLTDAALMLHTMRLDGFYYLKTLSSPGHLRTMPLTVTGPDLRINVCTPFGSARAQLLDGSGKVIPGCTMEDCEPFRGDALFWAPRWGSGKHGLSACDAAQRVSLELELTGAAVYAIRGDFDVLVRY